jgi:hypothetical protein
MLKEGLPIDTTLTQISFRRTVPLRRRKISQTFYRKNPLEKSCSSHLNGTSCVSLQNCYFIL